MKVKLFLISLITILSQLAMANQISWINAAGGNWNVGANWSSGTIPGSADTVLISLNGTYSLTLDISPTVNRLIIGAASGVQTLSSTSQTITVNGGIVINVNGKLQLAATAINGFGSITNLGNLQLINNNTITTSVNNGATGVIRISHQTNTMSGTLTTVAGSILSIDAANYPADLTLANGFTNNGTIDLRSVFTGWGTSLSVTSGTLTNAAGGLIHTIVENGGTRNLNAEINNQGTITIDHDLTIVKTGAVHHNTGSITIATGKTLTLNQGNFNFDGGSLTGAGTLNFTNSATYTVNTTNIPSPANTTFAASTLAAPLTITNLGNLQFINNNSITANVNNGVSGVIRISHQTNTMSGTLTTVAGSILSIDAASYPADLTLANGFTNNGTIDLRSVYTGWGTSLSVTSGTLTNAAGGLIHTIVENGGTRNLNAEINNQGTITIDHDLTIVKMGAMHHNTGSITIATGKILTFNQGNFNFDGGSLTGAGTLNFTNSATYTVNTTNIPSPANTTFAASTLAAPLMITNLGNLQFINNNSITANVNNGATGVIRISHQTNTMSGALTTLAGSILSIDAANYPADLTLANGFTNNGTIDLRSVYTGWGTSLSVTTGTLTNAAGGLIHTIVENGGTRNLNAEINNQGTITIDHDLTIVKIGAVHHNTGSITIATGKTLTLNQGNFNFDGGSLTGAGTLNFTNSATYTVNTANIPSPANTTFAASTLAAPLMITNLGNLQFINNNSITANVNNGATGVIRISHQTNTMSGTLTTVAGSILSIDAASYPADLTLANGFTNNGTIDLRSVYTGWGTSLSVTTGTLTNAAGGLIHTIVENGGTRNLNAEINNQGTITIDHDLTIVKTGAVHHNTGSITIATGKTLTLNQGNFNFDGGSLTGAGTLNFTNSATYTVNTANIPSPANTTFAASTLAAPLTITNLGNLQFINNNSITANVNNGVSGVIRISHQTNTMSGILTTVTGSILSIDAANYPADLTLANGFTNNGTIDLRSVYTGWGTSLNVTSGTLTNAAGGLIHTIVENGGTRNLNAEINNQGTMTIDHDLTIVKMGAVHHNTGSITIATGKILTFNQGNFNFDGGSLTGAGTLNFTNSATYTVNTANIPSPANTTFAASTLAAPLMITNLGNLQFINNNSITANVNNGATGIIRISHQTNTMSGALTTLAGSILSIDAANYPADLTLANGFTNNGTIDLRSVYTGWGTSLSVTTGTLTNAAGGLIHTIVENGGTRNLNSTVLNNGLISIDANTTVTSTSFVNNSGGTIKGSYVLTLTGTNLVNNGTISPGSSVGQLTLNGGNLNNSFPASFHVELGGYTPITQYDKLLIQNTANLSGDLNISLINGFTPVLGDSFIVMTYANKSGIFSSLSGSTIPGGLAFKKYERSTYTVLVAGQPVIHQIIATAGQNGTISPSDTVNVLDGDNQSFTIIPNTHYHVSDVTKDLVSIGAVSNYTFNNVTGAHSIHAEFSIDSVTISASAGVNGIISNAGSVQVPYSGIQTFTIIPDSCFKISDVLVDGISIGAASSYTFTNAILNHTISASFAPITVSISSSLGMTVCPGTTTMLNATGSGLSSYLWSSGETVQTISKGSGTWSVMASDSYGCAVSNSINISNYLVQPAAITANGPITFCPGDSVILTANTGSSYLWSNFASTQAIKVFGSGNYSVTVTDANGCASSSAATNVSVYSGTSAVITPGGPTTFCQGDSVTLNSSSGSAYLWSTGASTQSITVYTADNYSVTVSNTSGCAPATASVLVTVNSIPTVDAGTADSICTGGSITLDASGGTSYSWSPATGLSSELISNPIASPASPTTYTVTVSLNGCSATDTVVVNIKPVPAATITSNGPIAFCQGDSVLLTSSAGNAYQWSNSASTQAITVYASGNYSVTVTGANACSATSATTSVTVYPATVASISGSTAFCQGDSITLTSASGSDYLWSSGATTQSIIVSATGTYSVTVSSVYGCVSDSASITVTANPNPSTPVISANGSTNICIGDTVVLTSSTANTYLWNPGAVSSQSINVTTSGTYSVTAYNTYGCGTSSSGTFVNVNNPLNDFTGSPLLVFIPGATVNFSASTNGSGPFTYLWDFGGVATSGASAPSHTYSAIGFETVTLTVTDSIDGCVNTITKPAYIDVEQLFPSYALSTGTALDITGLAFMNPAKGIFTLSDGNYIITTDSGTTWSPYFTGNTEPLTGASIRPGNWFLTGENGLIMHSINEGTTWNTQTTSTIEKFNASAFSSANHGFAVGTNGLIQKFDGSIWTPEVSGVLEKLNSVEVLSNGNAIVVGDNQTILYYNGSSWTPQTAPLSFNAKGIKFSSALSGYAAGTNGVIIKTIDGGANWTPSLTGVDIDFSSVEVAGPDSAWAAGTKGIVYTTSDNGSTWIRYSVGNTRDQTGITVSQGRGYVTGHGGNGRTFGSTSISVHTSTIEKAIAECIVYPNPASDKVSISVLITEPTNLTIELKDATGRQLKTIENSVVTGKFNSELNLEHYNSGIYFIHIREGEKSWVKRVVITH